MNTLLQNGLRKVGCQVHSRLRKIRNQPSQVIRFNHPLKPDLWDRQKGLRGWVASTSPVASAIVIDDKGGEYPVELETRPDVQYFLRYQFPHHQGFICRRTVDEWLAHQSSVVLTLMVMLADGTKVSEEIKLTDRIAERNAKYARCREHLRCPETREKLVDSANALKASASDRIYPIENGIVNFLAEDFKVEFSIDDTENISSWDYDRKIIEIITANPEKLFLDCGAGLRKEYYPNVINFEIVPYSSTDILGVAEKLPFADNSMDGVISVAVLEHVKNPFLSASEITRVLKPGGTLFCSVPFMQPLHGYPHHYYNMTAEGMKNLFPGLKIEDVYVPRSLHPIQSLQWMLLSYMRGLPVSEHGRFANLRVKDIVHIPSFSEGRARQPSYIEKLSPEAMTEVAAGHCLIARKPE